MIKSIIYTFLFCIVTVIAIAQPVRDVPYKMLLEAAEEAEALNNPYGALEWYQKAYKESRDKDLAVKIAENYFELRDYKKASKWYERILKRDPAGLYADKKFDYGVALKMFGDYNTAHKVLNEFVSESTDEVRREQAMLEIIGIEQSATFPDNPDAMIRLASRKINSKSSESGAIPVGDDELYYSSLNRNEILIEGEDSEGESYFKIYKSKQDEGEYKKASALGEAINREGYHTSNPSITIDGSTMYFVRTFIEEGELVESKIYYSKMQDGDWGAASEVEGINGDYITKHPAVGELFGRNVLFFISDMDGGFGGMDLYYSESNGLGSFGTPKNLGSSINSPSDEVTPFYRDGVLYFSSNGRPGLGGFDIFKTEWDGSSWSPVQNLGTEYNSSADDIFYSMNREGNHGFLVSNRPAEGKRSLLSKTCCDDIFIINIKEVVIDLVTEVIDEDGKLMGANVVLYDLSEGEDRQSPHAKTNMQGNTFNFGLDANKKYKIVVSKDGYEKDSLEFNTVGLIEDHTVKRTVNLDKIPPPPPPKEEVEIVTINQPIRMSEIYYDFDDDKILPAAEKDLTIILNLMNQYPEMEIELSSHTDSQGTSSYNKKLSQRRANSAKAWLVARGIADSRITAVGYGEEKILNQCVNGVRCSDEEHRYNRRTEFTITAGPKSIEIRRPATKASSGIPSHTSNGVPKTTLQFVENNLQLGKVKIGEIKNFSFTFKNTGKNPLIIKTISTCHCTEYDYPKDPIAPGEQGVITASYDGSKKKNGPKEYREVINIICNTNNIVEEAIFHVEVVE